MLIEWLSRGGVILYLLVGISLLVTAVIMERFVYFRKADYKINSFLNAFFELLDVYQLDAAKSLCDSHDTPISHIALRGLKASNRSRSELKEVLANAGAYEVPKIESNLGVLATISYISPLLGLLGTVLGLLKAFQDFHSATLRGELPGPGLLANGIWEALLTTVAGLSVGIISYILHNYFYIKKERFISKLEESSEELLEIFSEKCNLS